MHFYGPLIKTQICIINRLLYMYVSLSISAYATLTFQLVPDIRMELTLRHSCPCALHIMMLQSGDTDINISAVKESLHL